MSWSVNGRVYHSYTEYQRALEARSLKQAREETTRLRDRARQYEQRIRARDAEIRQAQANAGEQRRLMEQNRADVRQLQRVQEQLNGAQRTMEQRVAREFSEVRAGLEQTQRGVSALETEHRRHAATVHQAFANVRSDMAREFSEVREGLQQTQGEVSALEAEHRRHVASVQQAFADVRSDMAKGFEEAKRRQAEGEARLQRGIDAVDAKVEADRTKRLQREANQLERARVLLGQVDEIAANIRSELGALGLAEEEHSVIEQVRQALELCDRGDAASALATGQTAYANARNLAHRAAQRRAEIDATVESLKERCAYLRNAMAEEQLAEVFPAEAQAVLGILDAIERRIQSGYKMFRRLDIEAARDEEDIAALEGEVRTMQGAAQVLCDRIQDRKVRAKEIIARLVRLYGPLSGARQRLAERGDPKSPLVIECDFGGAMVNVQVDVDGAYSLDGYRHGSDASCASKGQAMVRDLQETTLMGTSQVDLRDRPQPLASTRSEGEQWTGIGSRLKRIRDAQR